MATRNMSDWQTAICQVISNDEEEKIIVRNHDLDDLIGKLSFSAMMFLMLQGHLPNEAQTRVLDALMVGSMEHGIAPPSMIARCHASYGTPIPTAIGAGVSAFGERMGGLGERLAQLMVERLADLAPDAEPGDDELAARARAAVAEISGRGARVPGYGIPLHGRDPRAPKILEVARREGTYLRYCRFADAIEAALTEARGGRAVPMNLDGVSAAVILDLGFDWRSTQMFLLTPRTVSFGAHYLEEQGQDTTWRHIPAADIDYTG
jgi:citrate synthase